jgi:hypothetical protein
MERDLSETKRKPATRPRLSDISIPTIEMVAVADLRPNPKNPNKHPETQIQMLMASLQKDGQTRPIVARLANKSIIAGHGVTTAARRLGWTELRTVLLDVDAETANRLMLADQKLTTLSELERGRVAELMSEIGEGDWFSTGYSIEEAAKVLQGFSEKELEVFEIETATVTDLYWITLRGPLADQAIVLQAVRKLVKERFPSASIELGTTEDQ